MDRVIFTVNGEKCSVGTEADSDLFLVDYIRNVLNLRGTKFMCKEGGCGACIVTVTKEDVDGHKETFSINSCLVLVTQCHGWDIITIEGIGDRRKGYHPIQKTLAEYDGTQCGHCSPGWVMSMYGLLESNHYDVTQYKVEDSFGSNVCRCTGYRPILDAFKSFAKDAPKPNPHLQDIEDLKICENKGNCSKKCGKDWCIVQKPGVDDKILTIKLKDDHVWYRVTEMKDVFYVIEKEGVDNYMLVNGNTGRGVIPVLMFPRVLIDISPIKELKGHYIDQNLVVGAGTTLTNLMEIFYTVSKERPEFWYLEKLYEHLNLVAHIPVRNIGTIAGNLMQKHRLPVFSSDLFLLFESVGAMLTIIDKSSTADVYPVTFLDMNMTGKVITQIKFPPLSHIYQFVSFKVMPRSQSAHASVNAAFLYEFDPHYKEETVKSARLVITGLSGKFARAKETEEYLVHKKLFTNETLQGALKILDNEIIVEEIPGELTPEYRKKCALGLFYKGLLNLIPKARLKPWYRSGARDFRKTRPLSSGTEVYDTNPSIWPITEPMPKVEALIQCAGEAKYSNDLPTQPKEVWCAFVTSDICTGEIIEIDPSPALNLPGVLAFFTAKDIPGENTYIFPMAVPGSGMANEEVLADKTVKYYDQPIGIMVAETQRLAQRAALLVRVKYRKDKKEPIIKIDDARERDPSRISLFTAYPARDRGTNVTRILKGTDDISWQYHFTMEAETCVTRPNDFGLDVFSSTQWPDLTQAGVARVNKIEQNRVNVEIFRCGGSYGCRISRASHIAVACSLVTQLLNRPCRFVMGIQENMRCIGKRLPIQRKCEIGVDDKGEIQYLEYDLFSDNGYVFSEPIIGFTGPSVKSCYDNRRWQYKGFNVVTDTASNTYMRAPGSLEGITMTEQIMERISFELDLDPVQVRLNNLNRDRTEVAEMVQTLLRDSEYYKRRDEVIHFNKTNRWKKRGLRVAFMGYAIANIGIYHALLTVYHTDATVTFCHGGVEIGQGINTKVIQTIAYTLNISVDKIKIKSTDCVTSPNSFATGGSRTTEVVQFAAIKCCQLLLDRLTVVREGLNDPTFEQLINLAYSRGINLQTSFFATPADQTIYRTGGVAFTEVELDILTGEHEILRVDLIEDCGVSTNPESDIGQIEGAFVMGIGYWTHEHQIYDRKTGELLTDRTWYYHVPLAKDIPIDFRVQLRRNSYNPLGTLGAKAVSEPPMCLAISVAFALREAIASSRADSGKRANEYFNVEGPFTLEENVLKSEADVEEYLFY
ncbi:molybdopterin-binding domain of aldehyde dehydrogenase domain-containing protein [Phthorimaea operculella]|nr:molybdopterin-binding domain of aldehyde dehydrogenase domain-containing protein [Phthorimaea operculella]